MNNNLKALFLFLFLAIPGSVIALVLCSVVLGVVSMILKPLVGFDLIEHIKVYFNDEGEE